MQRVSILILGLCTALPLSLSPRPVEAARAEASIRLESVQALNSIIVELVNAYPKDASHPYLWKRGMHTDGTTRDLYFRGVQVADASPDGGIHCSGITFEVWLRALEKAGPPDWLTPEAVLQLKETWYIRDGDEKGMVDALVRLGLGKRIDKLADLQPGDLVQFWRNSGKGHSAVFINHRRNSDGTPRGMAYWSAQGSSEGIGVRFVSVGDGEHQIAPGRLYGVRPVVPKR